MAGMDVVADSNDPPTGQGVSRVARIKAEVEEDKVKEEKLHPLEEEDKHIHQL